MAQKKVVSVCAGLSRQRALQNTLLPSKKEGQLELDEVWSFVGHKKNRVWLWFVPCKRTRRKRTRRKRTRRKRTRRKRTRRKRTRRKRTRRKRTRQIIAWMPGERDIVTARDVWAKVPKDYKECLCFADGLEAYAHVIPSEQLHQHTKNQHTNHLERFNATLRGRVGRLVRKTLSFSKSYFFHITHIFLFIHQYNLECARKYQLSTQT
ncbi:hypothetical protein IAD21_00365 [Abditibacteriota bacterium]|nr:hypothetical protein IAD21_00365 [Abditibacteriota bacterium]